MYVCVCVSERKRERGGGVIITHQGCGNGGVVRTIGALSRNELKKNACNLSCRELSRIK